MLPPAQVRPWVWVCGLEGSRTFMVQTLDTHLRSLNFGANRVCLVGKIMASQGCPLPNPWTLLMWYGTWQRKIKVADGIKVANQMNLK